jgi:hypothetical protein
MFTYQAQLQMKSVTTQSSGLSSKIAWVLSMAVIFTAHPLHLNEQPAETAKVSYLRIVYLAAHLTFNLFIHSLVGKDRQPMHVFGKMHYPLI